MRLAVDVLEHEIRLAGRRDAGVDEVRDARVAQPGEDGAFAREPLFAGAADQRDVQQLDRGASLEAAVAALGEPHAAQPALSDMRHQPVGADHLTRERLHPRGPRIQHRAFEEARVVHGLMLSEDGAEVGGEGRVLAPRSRRQPGRPDVSRNLERLVQVRAEERATGQG